MRNPNVFCQLILEHGMYLQNKYFILLHLETWAYIADLHTNV